MLFPRQLRITSNPWLRSIVNGLPLWDQGFRKNRAIFFSLPFASVNVQIVQLTSQINNLNTKINTAAGGITGPGSGNAQAATNIFGQNVGSYGSNI